MTEYVFGSMAEKRNKGEARGALSCVGGLFRLGFGKLLREHVETPNPFHPQCSHGTTTLPLLLMVHVVKMLLPCLFFSLSSSPSSHSPPPFLTRVCLLALPVLPSPAYSPAMFCLFTSCCAVHAQGVCVCACFSCCSVNACMRG